MPSADPSSGKPQRTEAVNQIGMPPLVALRGAESLRKLRDRVRKAVDELGRLREENRKLAERIVELERGPVGDDNETLVKLSETPDNLRNRLDAFISAIDAHLAKNEA